MTEPRKSVITGGISASGSMKAATDTMNDNYVLSFSLLNLRLLFYDSFSSVSHALRPVFWPSADALGPVLPPPVGCAKDGAN